MPHILVIKTSSLGDIVHTLPLVLALKKERPAVDIDWVVKPMWRALFDELVKEQWIRRVLPYPPQKRFLTQLKHCALRSFSPVDYDVIFDFQGNLKSLSVLLSYPARQVYMARSYLDTHRGRREYWNPLFRFVPRRSLVPIPEGRVHIVDKQRTLLEAYLKKEIQPQGLNLIIPDSQREWARQFCEKQNLKSPLIVLLIRKGTSKWHSKSWPLDHYVDLAHLLRRQGLSCLLISGPSEVSLLRKKRGLSQFPHCSSSSLLQLAALLEQAKVAVGVDSGPTHLADALGTSVIGLMGPTSEARSAPYHFKSWVLRGEFCIRHYCGSSQGCLRRPSCVAQITPQTVLTRISEILEVQK